ncbi:MAG: AAA family ATPase [Candidatus Lokiarchaeota archaeon]|nr:AAA family ATPase [Candidatus Lokiarchaeota archaeon]
MSETLILGTSGKGGTGKTTFTALLLNLLRKSDKYQENGILVIDADPDTNLPTLIGHNVARADTIGGYASILKERISSGSLPPTIDKQKLLEGKVFERIIEADDFSYDLLTMGRHEGEGCYCFINSLLTGILDTYVKGYDLVLMDLEAGLEHLSRRTSSNVDIMFIITDPSKMGLETAKRIKELSDEVLIEFDKLYLVGNKFTEKMRDRLEKYANEIKVDDFTIIPYDEKIAEFNFEGKSLFNIDENSSALNAVRDFAHKIGIL